MRINRYGNERPIPGKRRPRWLGIAAVAAVIPTSLQPTFAIESAAAAIPNVASDIFFSTQHARHSVDAQMRSDHLNLPASATNITVLPVESEKVIDTTKVNPAIAHEAPYWGSDQYSGDGTLSTGSIRSLGYESNASTDGFGGLNAGQCSPNFDQTFPNGTALKLVNTNHFAAGEVSAKIDYNRLSICNTGYEDLSASALKGIYLQVFFPKARKA